MELELCRNKPLVAKFRFDTIETEFSGVQNICAFDKSVENEVSAIIGHHTRLCPCSQPVALAGMEIGALESASSLPVDVEEVRTRVGNDSSARAGEP